MKRKIVLTYLSPLVSVLGNLLLAYVVYFIARMTFLAENWNLYSDNLSWSHLMEMLRGGLMFDTTAILYTNALWVVMVRCSSPRTKSCAAKACAFLYKAQSEPATA